MVLSTINRLHTESTCIDYHRRQQSLHLLERFINNMMLLLLLLELGSGCPDLVPGLCTLLQMRRLLHMGELHLMMLLCILQLDSSGT